MVFFFCGKLTKQCRYSRTFQLVIQQSTFNKKYKKNIIATTVLFSTNIVIGALVYQGISSDLRSRLEQSHHIPGTLLARCSSGSLQSLHGRSYLQLYRKGAKIHYLCLYFEIIEKKVIFDKIYPCEVYLSSDICRMRWAITRPTAAEGLIMTFLIYILQPNGWIKN